MSFTVLIPARLASTRLPNKPLADIAGLPMVVRVAKRVASAISRASPARVVVAADSPLIIAACTEHGVEAVLTDTHHASGSDRLAQACDLLGLPDEGVVVNVQGDEPLIDPELVDAVAQLLQDRPQASISTAAHAITTLEDYLSPDVVKVVLDRQGNAMYFSRSPIPMARDFPGRLWWNSAPTPGATDLHAAAPLRHIGIYGYRARFLRLFPSLARAPLEIAETLEQLRAMWHGHKVAVYITERSPGPAVDTPEDLERVRRIVAG